MYRHTETYVSLHNPLSLPASLIPGRWREALQKPTGWKELTQCSLTVVIGFFLGCNFKYEFWHPPLRSPDMPKELRLQAVRAAVLLLPDENREAMQTLLCLLSDVTASVAENQMTPTNLAVCLAPSLFHLNTLRRKESSSPRCLSITCVPLHLLAICLAFSVTVIVLAACICSVHWEKQETLALSLTK